MFKKSKSKVLVDEASEEDDESWHREQKDKESEGTEEVLSPSTKDSKMKKVKSKRERGDKKLFPSQDDEHFLLTGVTLSHRRGSAKKVLDDEERSRPAPDRERDRVQYLWDSITMTMRQMAPNRRPDRADRMEGWEPPKLHPTNPEEEEKDDEEEGEARKRKSDSAPLSAQLSVSLPGLPSWAGLGAEEDASRYASLTSQSQPGRTAQWAARARGKLDKLTSTRRRSPGGPSDSAWEGLK